MGLAGKGDSSQKAEQHSADFAGNPFPIAMPLFCEGGRTNGAYPSVCNNGSEVHGPSPIMVLSIEEFFPSGPFRQDTDTSWTNGDVGKFVLYGIPTSNSGSFPGPHLLGKKPKARG
jgi:hypothetical protein